VSTQSLTAQHVQAARSDDLVIADLRDAASRATNGRLSSNTYDSTRRPGSLSSIRLWQRYGSWINVCEKAGVEPGAQRVRTYRRAYTPEVCRKAVSEYLAEEGSLGSYLNYSDWAKTHEAPSAQTLRNVYGSWNAAKADALGLPR
jgi:hypothetical protein